MDPEPLHSAEGIHLNRGRHYACRGWSKATSDTERWRSPEAPCWTPIFLEISSDWCTYLRLAQFGYYHCRRVHGYYFPRPPLCSSIRSKKETLQIRETSLPAARSLDLCLVNHCFLSALTFSTPLLLNGCINPQEKGYIQYTCVHALLCPPVRLHCIEDVCGVKRNTQCHLLLTLGLELLSLTGHSLSCFSFCSLLFVPLNTQLE